MYKNHFLNALSLGYFWEVWHEWLYLNFDSIPPVSKLLVSEKSPLKIFFPSSTNQDWSCLASETRQDPVYSGWFGCQLKIFLIGHFFPSLWGFLFSWILFVWLVLVPRWVGEVMSRSGGSQCKLDPSGQI
jgi:hypothetical protein